MANSEELEALGIETSKVSEIDSNTRHKLYELFCSEVLPTLKAPATAQFCKEEEIIIKEDMTGVYFVTGWVDSQNSYGAMIRTYINKFKIINENGIYIPKSNASVMASSKLAKQMTGYWIYGIISTIILFIIFYAIFGMF